MNTREKLTMALSYEPIRAFTGLALAALAIVVTAGVAVPMWVVAIGAALTAELSRSQVTSLQAAAVQDSETYYDGLNDGIDLVAVTFQDNPIPGQLTLDDDEGDV